MSKYIKQATIDEINKTIDVVLKDTNIFSPPVNYNNIINLEKLDYDLFKEEDSNYQELLKSIGQCPSFKLRGVLLVPDKQLFIKHENYEKRINYTIGHELGHWCLSWHNELLYCCSEFDLRPNVRKQLELEANYFSCRLGFMNGLFNSEMADYPLNLDSIKSLSDKYNMSVEASLRSAVEHEHRACAFIVMDYNKTDKGYEFKKKYSLESKSFSERMGDFVFKDNFEPNHIITQIMNDPTLRTKNSQIIEVKLPSKKDRKEVPAIAEVWYHSYGVIALFVLK